MFEALSYQYKLWKLQRDKEHDLKPLRDAATAARKRGDWDEENKQVASVFAITDLYDDDIALLQTRYLLAVADRLLVPVPEYNEESPAWTKDKSHGNRVYLSREGAQDLQAKIRQERKHRREARDGWLPWIGALTGLVGALTGLLAVWLSRG